ncbi:MAG: hypothetical protein WD894_16055 [Pirellulales bacterium]
MIVSTAVTKFVSTIARLFQATTSRCAVSVTVGWLLLASQSNGQATFTPLGVFGGTESIATDVSGEGSVVVGKVRLSGATFAAFRWTSSESMLHEGLASDSVAVSADGAVVVGGYLSPSLQAFRWPGGGAFQGLGDLPGGVFRSSATDVSANGSVIVGFGTTADGPEAFRWTAATGMVGIGSLDGGESSASSVSTDGSVVVGGTIASPPLGSQGFRWTPTGGMVALPRPPGAVTSGARKVSADGAVVVGFNQFSLNDTEAFRWTERDGMIGLGDLPGGRRISEAYDVSADGSVIVGMSENQDGRKAFYWTRQTGMLNLEDLLVSFGANNLDGWLLIEAQGVSSDGFTVAGRGVHNGREEAWVATIPEPSTLILATIAILLLLTLYRRHQLPIPSIRGK